MIDSMFLFRSNLRIYESYHYCKTWEELKNECWDFYVNMGIWALENKRLHRFKVYRLEPKLLGGLNPINYTLYSLSLFEQQFVKSFSSITKNNKPDISPDVCFWRGGFKEYDEVIINVPLFKKTFNIYCGSGQRIYPQYGAKYNLHLIEDERDLNSQFSCEYFYKTANPKIFYNINNNEDKKYDICFPCNFSSSKYKGQEFFIKKISESKFLQSLKIVHIGNESKIGKKLCKKYKVTNIEFLGYLERSEINKILNLSKFAIVCSNKRDGCPRIVSEILCSGTPLLLRNNTRLLSYYKKHGVQTFSDDNISQKIEKAFSSYKLLKEDLNDNLDRLSMNKICTKNFDLWEKKMGS